MSRLNITQRLDMLVDYSNSCHHRLPVIRVRVTERYLRRRLKLKKKDPLSYRGVPIKIEQRLS